MDFTAMDRRNPIPCRRCCCCCCYFLFRRRRPIFSIRFPERPAVGGGHWPPHSKRGPPRGRGAWGPGPRGGGGGGGAVGAPPHGPPVRDAGPVVAPWAVGPGEDSWDGLNGGADEAGGASPGNMDVILEQVRLWFESSSSKFGDSLLCFDA